MSLAVLADQIARQGRNGDSMLVHMTPSEVAGLHALALTHGGSLTINPETGLPEAGFLSNLFKAVLPMVAGFALGPAGFGLVESALGAGAIVGGVTGLATGSLQKGLMAGIGAYGGFNLGQGLTSAGISGAQQAAMNAAEGASANVLNADELAQMKAIAAKQATQDWLAQNPLDKFSSGIGALGTEAGRGSFMEGVGGTKGLIGAGLAAATPAMTQIQTTTKMPTLATSTPYLRPMIMDRQLAPAQPLTGSSERKWFETKYEVPPPTNLLTGQRLPAPSQQTVTQTVPGSPDNQYPPGVYDQPYYGGLNGGGLVAFADGGTPLDVPEIIKARQQLNIPQQTPVYLSDVPEYTKKKSNVPESVMSKVTYGNKLTDFVEDPNLTASTTNLPGLTGESQSAYDYLMGGSRVSTPQTPPRNTALTVAMPRITPSATSNVSTGASSGLGGGSGVGAGTGINAGAASGVGITASLPEGSDSSFNNTLGPSGPFVPSGPPKLDWYDDGGSDNTGGNTGNLDLDYYVNDKGNIVDSSGTDTVMPGGSITKGVIPYVVGEQPPAPIEDRIPKPVDNTGASDINNIDNTFYNQGSNNSSDNFERYDDTLYNQASSGQDVGGNVATTGNDFGNYDDYGSTANTGNVATSADNSGLGFFANQGSQVGDQTMGQSGNVATQNDNQMAQTGNVASQDSSALDYVTQKYADTGSYNQASSSEVPITNNVISTIASRADLPTDTVKDIVQTAMQNSSDSSGAINQIATELMIQSDLNPNEAFQIASNALGEKDMGADEFGGSDMMMAYGGRVQQFGTYANGGGIYNLGGYSDGGRLLRGPGDGVSDSIPATIGNRTPARLADGEFVVPARIVSELGNGSTEAGARKLYAMMDRVQRARTKSIGKGKVAQNSNADRYLPA